jgi:hypothetical protein
MQNADTIEDSIEAQASQEEEQSQEVDEGKGSFSTKLNIFNHFVSRNRSLLIHRRI